MVKSIDLFLAPWRKPAVGIAVAATAALLASPAAIPATVTYTSPSCTSFVVSGTPPNQTITCSGGGGGVPTCAPSANPPSPASGQATTITANCSNQPQTNGYVWTGAACIGLTGPTCTVAGKAHHTVITYTVSASNAAGTGPPAVITISW